MIDFFCFSSLSPYSFDVSPSSIDVPQVSHDSIPIGAIPILATSTADYVEAVSRTINAANAVYQGKYTKTSELKWLNFQLLPNFF